MKLMTASFLCCVAMKLIREIPTDHGKQKRPEAGPRRIDIRQPALFEQAFEESLCEVLSFFAGVAAATNIRINGPPIISAEFLQGRGLRLTILRGAQHDRPVSGGELLRDAESTRIGFRRTHVRKDRRSATGAPAPS